MEFRFVARSVQKLSSVSGPGCWPSLSGSSGSDFRTVLICLVHVTTHDSRMCIRSWSSAATSSVASRLSISTSRKNSETEIALHKHTGGESCYHMCVDISFVNRAGKSISEPARDRHLRAEAEWFCLASGQLPRTHSR